MSNLFVCLMGMGVTFVGLICLIFLSLIMGAICQRFRKAEPAKAAEAPVSQPPVQEIPNRGAMVAAVSAALAEELGTEVSAIRILKGQAAYIDPARCVGCGRCAAECPASVIALREVPA